MMTTPMMFLVLLLPQQDPHPEYRHAEASARRALDLLGIPTNHVRVEYVDLGRDLGDQGGHLIRINPRKFPASLRSEYHEFWHQAQQEWFGGEEAFRKAYDRWGRTESNPFEREARQIARRLESLDRAGQSWFLRRFDGKNYYERNMARVLAEELPALKRIWKGSEISPRHLDRLERTLNTMSAHPVRERFSVRREAGGAVLYGVSFVFKEALHAAESGRVDRFTEGVRGMATTSFLRDTGAFTLAARVAANGLAQLPLSAKGQAFAGATVPLTAGMIAVGLVSNQSPGDIALTTASALAVGSVVHLALPLGSVRGAARAILTVRNLTLAGFAADHVNEWLRRWGDPGPSKTEETASSEEPRYGVEETLRAMAGLPVDSSATAPAPPDTTTPPRPRRRARRLTDEELRKLKEKLFPPKPAPPDSSGTKPDSTRAIPPTDSTKADTTSSGGTTPSDTTVAPTDSSGTAANDSTSRSDSTATTPPDSTTPSAPPASPERAMYETLKERMRGGLDPFGAFVHALVEGGDRTYRGDAIREMLSGPGFGEQQFMGRLFGGVDRIEVKGRKVTLHMKKTEAIKIIDPNDGTLQGLIRLKSRNQFKFEWKEGKQRLVLKDFDGFEAAEKEDSHFYGIKQMDFYRNTQNHPMLKFKAGISVLFTSITKSIEIDMSPYVVKPND